MLKLVRVVYLWVFFTGIAYGLANVDLIKEFIRSHIGHADDYELRDDLVNGRYFSRRSSFNSTDGAQSLNTAHISQTLARAGDNIFSTSKSQINPTITNVGFEGAPFYIRASGGTGVRSFAAITGNLGLLMPQTTISLRATNQGAQACNMDVIFTFTEVPLPPELL